MSKSLNRFYRAVAGVAFLGLLVAANEVARLARVARPRRRRPCLGALSRRSGLISRRRLKHSAVAPKLHDRDLYVFCGDGGDGLIPPMAPTRL